MSAPSTPASSMHYKSSTASITNNKNLIRINFNVSSLKQLGFEEPSSQSVILVYMNESRVLKKGL